MPGKIDFTTHSWVTACRLKTTDLGHLRQKSEN